MTPKAALPFDEASIKKTTAYAIIAKVHASHFPNGFPIYVNLNVVFDHLNRSPGAVLKKKTTHMVSRDFVTSNFAEWRGEKNNWADCDLIPNCSIESVFALYVLYNGKVDRTGWTELDLEWLCAAPGTPRRVPPFWYGSGLPDPRWVNKYTEPHTNINTARTAGMITFDLNQVFRSTVPDKFIRHKAVETIEKPLPPAEPENVEKSIEESDSSSSDDDDSDNNNEEDDDEPKPVRKPTARRSANEPLRFRYDSAHPMGAHPMYAASGYSNQAYNMEHAQPRPWANTMSYSASHAGANNNTPFPGAHNIMYPQNPYTPSYIPNITPAKREHTPEEVTPFANNAILSTLSDEDRRTHTEDMVKTMYMQLRSLLLVVDKHPEWCMAFEEAQELVKEEETTELGNWVKKQGKRTKKE